ncbi:PEPxxWA-CTERM sorting domain-containing protein [uncultured Sphingomonas sp.]|uniref:PEPxxWA-CTERM sorting domain-containing protein n=1 Tax=uncultured Sphingomonas sp. TaxID=158754 RepID=UPI0025E6F693|nr:PEPxxWA-CTERM sorting domain-containing protein [uncultured Sphingomonas sp.]
MKRFKTLLAGAAIIAGAQFVAGAANAATVLCPTMASCTFEDNSGSAAAFVGGGKTATSSFSILLPKAGGFEISLTAGKKGITFSNLVFNGVTIASPVAGTLYDFFVTKSGWYDVSFTASNSNIAPVSNSASYSFAAVPEPAAWGLMIAGFGMAGASIRRRRNVRVAVA